MNVPNFRVPHRLIEWMQVNNVRDRIPSSENLFFKERIHLFSRANSLVGYSLLVGRLPEEMERVIAQVPVACYNYASTVYSLNGEINPAIVDGACADPNFITKLAGLVGRILRHEAGIQNPDLYIEYAAAVGERIPEIEDRVFFSDSSPRRDRANAAVSFIKKLISFGYGRPTHPIMDDARIMELIRSEPEAVMSFMEIMGSRGCKLDESFHWSLAGDGHRLFKLSENLRSRLPLDLEATWQGYPKELVVYAARRVRGPLPEELEHVLLGDTESIADYAFNVIRANSSPRLSGALHNCMIMSDGEHVKKYVSECERVEAQVGEWAARFRPE